jgi:hypothetical protein
VLRAAALRAALPTVGLYVEAFTAIVAVKTIHIFGDSPRIAVSRGPGSKIGESGVGHL